MFKANLNKLLIVLIIILVVAVGALMYWQIGNKERAYWAVYLQTGDMYFGKLSYFPKTALSDVWFIQPTQDQENPLSLARFSNAFWGPADKIYLDADKIVWKTKLRSDSAVLQAIKNPQFLQQQPQQQPQQQNQQSGQ